MLFSSRKLATSLFMRRSIHTIARAPASAIEDANESFVLVYDSPEFKRKRHNCVIIYDRAERCLSTGPKFHR